MSRDLSEMSSTQRNLIHRIWESEGIYYLTNHEKRSASILRDRFAAVEIDESCEYAEEVTLTSAGVEFASKMWPKGPKEPTMKTTTFRIAEGRQVLVYHNVDWSGDAIVTWHDVPWTERTIRGQHEVTIPAQLLLAIGRKAAFGEAKDRIIQAIEALEGL